MPEGLLASSVPVGTMEFLVSHCQTSGRGVEGVGRSNEMLRLKRLAVLQLCLHESIQDDGIVVLAYSTPSAQTGKI